MTIGARISTRPGPKQLGLQDIICTSKFKATSLTTRMKTLTSDAVFTKGKLTAGKPIQSDAP